MNNDGFTDSLFPVPVFPGRVIQEKGKQWCKISALILLQREIVIKKMCGSLRDGTDPRVVMYDQTRNCEGRSALNLNRLFFYQLYIFSVIAVMILQKINSIR